ncbi:MAG: transcription factor WhiB [Candidatus Saccharibacteria bacterium GW2011_GWC2_48_9]|nr:MAG: transcription factor WhiB [Candidatus Saccharibacteria bacterium GW2011_GWC2_48_9]HCH34067.1 WhiB family transcriptional regulator [Candidatus Saccharibacteria bacterium]
MHENKPTQPGAECRDSPADFFPMEGENNVAFNRRAEKELIPICARCAITATCLEGALSRNEQFGVWGGTTPRQRSAMRIPRARK